MSNSDAIEPVSDQPRKKDERIAFAFLAIFFAPILAVAIVGGYGFLIWMSQMLLGPPTG